MHSIYYGGQLSDKQKQQLLRIDGYPIKSQYAIYYRNKLHWVWAFTYAQAKFLVKQRYWSAERR